MFLLQQEGNTMTVEEGYILLTDTGTLFMKLIKFYMKNSTIMLLFLWVLNY